MTPSMRKRSEGESYGHQTDQEHTRLPARAQGDRRANARKRNTPAGDRLDVLVVLVEAWEAKHYRLDLPDPIEAIKYHMEQQGLSPHDLTPFIGGRNRVYEVLVRKRPLTLKMIWRLHKGLGIPAESLIKGGQQQPT
jgi:HTH-type transcriptional regulator/antitoxin HigA